MWSTGPPRAPLPEQAFLSEVEPEEREKQDGDLANNTTILNYMFALVVMFLRYS